MSLNVLTQGGGTGGASASIFVTGLSETDTVTATKDGKTVKGKWNGDGHTIKIKDYGTWTVTATNGEDTTTQDVLVDAAVDYEIEMAYRLWLYREGDECEDVTGGYEAMDYSSCVDFGRNSDHLLIQTTKSNATFTGAYWLTRNQFPLDGYSKLMVRYDIYVAVNNDFCNVYCNINLLSDLSTPEDVWTHGTVIVGEALDRGNTKTLWTETDAVAEVDIPEFSGLAYLTIDMETGYYKSGTVQYKIKEIWLE